MRIASVIFVSSVAVLMLAAPTSAKHPEAQKRDEDGASSCHAYQQAADGSWQQLPCQEFGNGQTRHKPVAKGGEEEPR